jgi:hypothetical protein
MYLNVSKRQRSFKISLQYTARSIIFFMYKELKTIGVSSELHDFNTRLKSGTTEKEIRINLIRTWLTALIIRNLSQHHHDAFIIL